MTLERCSRRLAASSAALTAFAIVCGCARTSHPRRPGGEFLKAIELEGNRKVHEDALVTGLALRRTQQRGRAPDPYQIQLDADRIRGEYLRRGYLDVDVRSRVEREGDAVTVIYSVDEGVRARTDVVITGLPDDPELPVSKIREALPIEEGEPFAYEPYDEAKPALETVVADAGYAYAELDARVIADRASNTATIRLDYDLGPKSQFGTITVNGVEGELREAVENRLRFVPGQQYSTRAILMTQRALYGLNRFSTVRVTPALEGRPANPVVDVTVDVAQSSRHEIKLGGGFGLDPASYEVRGRAGYSVAGWLLPLNTLTIDLRPAYALLRDGEDYQPRIRALVRVERQDVLWTHSKALIEAGWNYIAYEAYTSYGPRARLGFSTPIGTDRLLLDVGWGIRRHDFRTIHPLVDEALQMQLGIDATERVAAFQQAIIADLRDHPVETKLGIYAELRVAEATSYAGSAYEYLQIVPELRGFVPLGPRSSWRTPVIAARVRGGVILGELAPTERFFSGGATSHRGFSERELSPSVIGMVDDQLRSVPFGGGAMVLASAEARVPIVTVREMPLIGVVFLDGGDVTETEEDLDLGDLHWAVGGGLRLDTIVGPVRFDVGYRLNRKGGMEPEPGSSFRFHLSLGEAY